MIFAKVGDIQTAVLAIYAEEYVPKIRYIQIGLLTLKIRFMVECLPRKVLWYSGYTLIFATGGVIIALIFAQEYLPS